MEGYFSQSLLVYSYNEKWINPVDGIITSSFGERTNPVLNTVEMHNGIDIAVDLGTRVVAVKSGEISQVRVSETFGNVVHYITDDGYEIMYAHLDSAAAVPGQRVEQGQVIAYSGNTGLTTGEHLHYSIWENGELVDPIYYVNLSYTVEVSQEYKNRGQVLSYMSGK